MLQTSPDLGQDIIRCKLCTNVVEHHCNLCHVDLCSNCISKHMSDKTKRHEVVEFINRKEGAILPECKSHDSTFCEMFCNDCQEPTCVMCVTTTHKKHDITDINSVLETFRERIIADVAELENTVRTKYKQDPGTTKLLTEFDKVMNSIQDQEDKLCKCVREIGSQLKDEVAKQKREFELKNEEVKSSIAKREQELGLVIHNNRMVLESNDAKRILGYQSKNHLFKRGPKRIRFFYPMFEQGNVFPTTLQSMFGSLQSHCVLNDDGKMDMKNAMTNPVITSTIKSPYVKGSKLWRVLCDETGKIWVSGEDGNVYQMDKRGSILKTIHVGSNIFALSLNNESELIFSLVWSETKIFKYDGKEIRTLIDLKQWCPRGLCHSANGDLLVSMRSVNKARSFVARYSGIKEIQIIENEKEGTPLFSVGVPTGLHLTENGNRDICVADQADESVVVVNASGKLRFKYRGTNTRNPDYKSFKPSKIVTDVNNRILINDPPNDVVHVIDCDGIFFRCIEYPCRGGLSIDTDCNLVIGGRHDGKIRIIKYSQ